MSVPDTVFTLAMAKEHLRVLHNDEDALITRMLDAAVAEVERITRRAWTERKWSVAVSACDADGCDSAVFHALLSPATVEAVTFDSGGADVPIPPANVITTTRYGHTVVRVKDWGAIGTEGDVGRLDYTAKPPLEMVPADVFAAVMLYLGDLYENREAQIIGTVVARNEQAEILLRPYVIEMYA